MDADVVEVYEVAVKELDDHIELLALWDWPILLRCYGLHRLWQRCQRPPRWHWQVRRLGQDRLSSIGASRLVSHKAFHMKPFLRSTGAKRETENKAGEKAGESKNLETVKNKPKKHGGQQSIEETKKDEGKHIRTRPRRRRVQSLR